MFGSLFYNSFSVMRLYYIDDRVYGDEGLMSTNIHALSRIQTHTVNIQVIKAYASNCGHWIFVSV
jgi:hypothetical protein